MLESLVHAEASFVTLTYNNENLPEGGTLVPRDLQLFLKRLRKHETVRYFGVGEYGDRTWRPHYHLALFGVGPDRENIIRASWGGGFVHVGELTFESAQYIAGYVAKKLTKHDDPSLEGRYPEFARMSLRPGIGAVALPQIIREIQASAHARRLGVPRVLGTGRKTLPLGRYLRERLRIGLDLPKEEFVVDEELQAVRDAYWLASSGEEISFQTFLQKMNYGRILQMEKRSKLYGKVKSL